MPKIAANGNPSYAGHEGLVVNAHDTVYEVNASKNIDGERPDGYTEEEVGELEESTAPGLGGPINPVTEPDSAPDLDEGGDDEGKKDGDHWDVAHPKPDNEVPGWDEPKKDETQGNTTVPTTDDESGVSARKSTPAKKTTPAAKK